MTNNKRGEEEGPQGDEVQRVLDAPGVPWRDEEEVQAQGGDGRDDRRGGEAAGEGQQHHRDEQHHRGRRDVESEALADVRQHDHPGAAEHRLGHRQPEFAGLVLRHRSARSRNGVVIRIAAGPDGVQPGAPLPEWGIVPLSRARFLEGVSPGRDPWPKVPTRPPRGTVS